MITGTNLFLEKNAKRRNLETLVENRTIYSINQAELNIFETHTAAFAVDLQFGSPVLASMLKGKKIMHLPGNEPFEFFPGESVVIPSNEMMRIDFPEAQNDNPTQCLALAMSEEKISKTVQLWNENAPRIDCKREWKFSGQNFHFMNDLAINQILSRLMFLFAEDHPAKDHFAENMMQELIIRLMQTEARQVLTENNWVHANNNRLAFVMKFIQEHLHERLTIEQLSEKACMSQAQFFRSFKTELGISPIDFINRERIKAAMKMLKEKQKTVYDASFFCGFQNVNHFIKLFKKFTGQTPKQFQMKG